MLLATQGGEGFAGEAGKNAWQGFTRLSRLVRDRFRGDGQACTALERVEEHPDDVSGITQLARAIRGYAEKHDDFRENLAELVAEARTHPRTAPILVRIEGNARVGKLTTFSGPVYGDVTF